VNTYENGKIAVHSEILIIVIVYVMILSEFLQDGCKVAFLGEVFTVPSF